MAHALPSANKLDRMVQRSSSSVTRRSVPIWFSIFFGYAKKSFANFLAKINYIKLFAKIQCMMADMLYIFRHVCKIAKSDYYLRHVCPSVRMEHLGSHWTDFHETSYLDIF